MHFNISVYLPLFLSSRASSLSLSFSLSVTLGMFSSIGFFKITHSIRIPQHVAHGILKSVGRICRGLVTCWRRLASNQPWLSLCSICRNLGFYSHHFNFSLKYADQQWNIWIYYVIKNESILGSIIETFYIFQMKEVIDTLKDNFDKIEKVWILFNLENHL